MNNIKEQKQQTFNADWFSKNIPTWDKYLSHLKNKRYLEALEVGCWEGKSTCWLLENILTGEGSKITCVDTFLGNPENVVFGYENNVRENFINNISAIGASDKVSLIEQPSQTALKFLHEKSFDLIYIDGSHVTTDVLTDLVLSWRLLKNGGVMIIDDYKYIFPEMDCMPGQAVDAFHVIFKKEIISLHQDWQVIWRKI